MYTEKARRVIFFARYEASISGSPSIEPEHLLLGVLREDRPLTIRFFPSDESLKSIRLQIEQCTPARERISTSIDLPMSEASNRVLAYSGEEADRLSRPAVGTEHLLLGLLRNEESFAAQILRQFVDVTLDAVRQYASANSETSKLVQDEGHRATIDRKSVV